MRPILADHRTRLAGRAAGWECRASARVAAEGSPAEGREDRPQRCGQLGDLQRDGLGVALVEHHPEAGQQHALGDRLHPALGELLPLLRRDVPGHQRQHAGLLGVEVLAQRRDQLGEVVGEPRRVLDRRRRAPGRDQRRAPVEEPVRRPRAGPPSAGRAARARPVPVATSRSQSSSSSIVWWCSTRPVQRSTWSATSSARRTVPRSGTRRTAGTASRSSRRKLVCATAIIRTSVSPGPNSTPGVVPVVAGAHWVRRQARRRVPGARPGRSTRTCRRSGRRGR